MGTLRRRYGDAGFGLIEMIVALLIAGMVFGALATTLVASLRSSLLSRQNQQATDYMTQAIEEMRLMDYGSLSVSAAALAGDPKVLNCGGNPCIAVNGTDELLVTATVPGVTAVSTLLDTQTNGTTFTLRRYVTATAGTGPDLVRRVTVDISWTTYGATHTRSTSTIIAYSQRGLPLPSFTLKPATSSETINPGDYAVHTFTLENKGAPDRWNLTLTGATTGFQLYADTDNSGSYEPGTDALLTDTSADGIVDTGRVEPGTTVRFFLVLSTTSATPLATLTTTLKATSVAQPTASTASATAAATTIIQAGLVTPTPVPTPSSTSPGPSPSPTETVCSAASVPTPSVSGYTTRAYALHNAGYTSSPTLPQLDMNASAATSATLGTFSTDQAPTLTGRQVVGSSASSAAALVALTDPTTYADWFLTVGKKTNIAGQAVLQLWVAGTAGATPGETVPVVLYTTTSSGSSPTVLSFVNGTVTAGCAGFQQIAVTLPAITAQAISKNYQLHVRAALSSTARFGYDSTQMPAQLAVSLK